MKFYITTLGCKVNQYESRALSETWAALGTSVQQPELAELIVVNSCAVTSKAVADLRNTVRRLHRAAPLAEIIITGCAAQTMFAELALLPGVSKIVKQSDKAELLRYLAQKTDWREIAAANAGFPPFQLSGSDRSRAVLKIQDGCSHGCTYCIVPLSRGRARSRAFVDSLAEAERLLQSGFREIILSGVNLRQYSQNAEGAGNHDFWDFLLQLDSHLSEQWAGKARLRISSLEPGQLDSKALDTLAACKMLAPHLHISLQSGSEKVLRRMGRGHYSLRGLADFLAGLRKLWPVYGLGADLLTAFPGESAEEFAESLALCRELPLTYAHVFPYSKRPGTAAALMGQQLGAAVKKERAASLRSLIAKKKQNFLEELAAGHKLNVVFEDRQKESSGSKEQESKPVEFSFRGVCEYYADCCLSLPSEKESGFSERIKPGELTPVTGTGVYNELLVVQAAGQYE